MRFRSDIEGLRAVAVGLVIGDHLVGQPLGGFIGVDVFFVISGFLISGLLLAEGERTGRVSIREFYARRVRRILPVAVLVLVSTVAAAKLVFTTSRAGETLTDALWAGGFLANVRFGSTGTDYFEQGLPPSPLQHYWSLSVEEQFYVVWPLTLLLLFAVGRRVRRFPTRAVVGAAALATFAVSLAWCVSLTERSPTEAYFATPARAWELSLGALLAVSASVLLRLPELLRAGLSWAGLVGIGAGSVLITPETPFPGTAALLPVLSTGLVLAAGNPRFGPGRTLVLGNPVVQYVGKLSYSLYLWHWPCIVVATAYWGRGGFGWWLSSAVLAALLSMLSFHLVEDPVRRSSWLSAHRPDRPRLTVASWWRDNRRGLDLAIVGATATALVIAGYVDLEEQPGTGRATTLVVPVAQTGDPALTVHQRALSAALAATSWDVDRFDPSLDELRASPSGCTSVLPADVDRCVWGTGPKTAVVLGDSIAMAWVPAVREALGPGWRVQMLTLSECPAPLLPTYRNASTSGAPYAACQSYRDFRLEQVQRLEPDLVLASSLPDFANRIVGSTDSAAYASWRDGTAALLRALAPSADRVGVLAAPPQSANLQECATVRSRPADCATSLNAHARRVAEAERAAAASQKALFIDPVDWFCLDRRCPAVVGTTPVLRDGTHLTEAFARRVAPLLRAALAGPDDAEGRVRAALATTEWGELSPSLDVLRSALAPEWGRDSCLNIDPANQGRCVYGNTAGHKTAVVLGDSVASSWLPGIRAALDGSDWRIQVLTFGECPLPLLPTARNASTRGTEFRACTEHRERALAEVARIRPDLVIASSSPSFATRIVGIKTYEAPENFAAWQQGTAATLRRLVPHAEEVVLLAAPPKSGNLQTCVTARSTPADCVLPVSFGWRGAAAAEKAAATATGARYLDTSPWFCFQGRCPAVIGSTPVMWDGSHITAAFSRSLGDLLHRELLTRRP